MLRYGPHLLRIRLLLLCLRPLLLCFRPLLLCFRPLLLFLRPLLLCLGPFLLCFRPRLLCLRPLLLCLRPLLLCLRPLLLCLGPHLLTVMGAHFATTVKYLGASDEHDPRFDDMRVQVNTSLHQYDPTLPFDADNELGNVVTFTFHLYPSKTLEDQYKSNKPMIYAIIVACIFIATSLSFVLYDYLITHEQNRLTRLALKSSRIVDSLFPAVVRKRLFGDEVGEATAMAGGSEAGGSTTEKLRRFMHGNTKNMSKKKNELPGSNMGSVESEYSLSNEVLSSPIADKYEGTTVLFADLAGFTAWSSGRPADHVFLLLESLYREFDRLALELGIFKVETIGDCYMAVCGVPDPREDHALAMAKFAMGMQLEMIKVQKHLVLRLGDNVMDLKLRCGFHSGPVTAGVVRGQRARFQLFGDTVNTASRMESTGRPGAVQISTTSFDQLKAAGKEEWCRAREDVVEAKGKGRLQTYWLVGDAAHQAAFTAASTRQDEFVTSVAPPLPDGAGLGIMTV